MPARTGLRLQETIEAKRDRQMEYGRTDDNRINTAAEWRGVEAGFRDSRDLASLGVPFQPDWDKQVYFCVVPCKASVSYHWRRWTLCSTLGDMFMSLGVYYTASEIYDFYRTRRIVARKVERPLPSCCCPELF